MPHDAPAHAGPAVPDDPSGLNLVLWPDPRLRRVSRPVRLDDSGEMARVRRLAARMLELMRHHEGVGLAAPQVGVNVRIFVMNPGKRRGEPDSGDRVYLNPVLSVPGDRGDEKQDDEGCLSLPDVTTPAWRQVRLKLDAFGPDGHAVSDTAEGFVPRVWQHEIDHLDGVLILDRMTPTARLAAKPLLRGLEERFTSSQPSSAPKSARKATLARRLLRGKRR